MKIRAIVLFGWSWLAVACSGEQPAASAAPPTPAAEIKPESAQPAVAAADPQHLPSTPAGSENSHTSPQGPTEPIANAAKAEARRDPAAAKSAPKAESLHNKPATPEPSAPSTGTDSTQHEKPASDPAATEVTGVCGDRNQPSCPLQGWMEKHLQAPLDDGNFAAVASGLARAAKLAPLPSWNDGPNGWKALTEAGIGAANRGDGAATKQACKACHKAWRAKYKDAYRKRVLAE